MKSGGAAFGNIIRRPFRRRGRRHGCSRSSSRSCSRGSGALTGGGGRGRGDRSSGGSEPETSRLPLRMVVQHFFVDQAWRREKGKVERRAGRWRLGLLPTTTKAASGQGRIYARPFRHAAGIQTSPPRVNGRMRFATSSTSGCVKSALIDGKVRRAKHTPPLSGIETARAPHNHGGGQKGHARNERSNRREPRERPLLQADTAFCACPKAV